MSHLEETGSQTQQSLIPIWASKSIDSDVTQVLQALEEGMSITLITSFNLLTCEPDNMVAEVLSRSDLQDFDYVPVRDEFEGVIGVLVGEDNPNHSKSVRAVMRPLHPSMLISADASLLSFIEEADKTPFCLVVRGRKIAGIVTLSDLQKLPVRPALFMRITALELLMAEWLRQKYTDEEVWLSVLSNGRQDRINQKWQGLQKSNMAIDRISTTDFCDKREAVLRLGDFHEQEPKVKDKLKAIETLRHSVAHAGDYALTPKTAREVAPTVRWARELIHLLQSKLMSSQSQAN